MAWRLRLEVPTAPGPDERLELTPRPADGYAILGYHLGTIELVIRDIRGGKIARVGLRIPIHLA